MSMALAQTLAFYFLVLIAPDKPIEYLRLEGGWDSCQLVEAAFNKAAPEIFTHCMSGIEWHLAGRPK
jgi:hypothetical protein